MKKIMAFILSAMLMAGNVCMNVSADTITGKRIDNNMMHFVFNNPKL